jgi:hypothetical protein
MAASQPSNLSTSPASSASSAAVTVNHSSRVVGGTTYFLGYLPQHGWSTGPCVSAAGVATRAAAYVAGDEITEAPDGIAGRGEMVAALAYAEVAGFRDGGTTVRSLSNALESGLGSDDWLRANAFVLAYYAAIVEHAGKISVTWVRRAS